MTKLESRVRTVIAHVIGIGAMVAGPLAAAGHVVPGATGGWLVAAGAAVLVTDRYLAQAERALTPKS